MRQFERRDSRQGARLISTYRIVCSRCGVLAHVNGRIPLDLISKKFQERGWHVGRTEAEDLCPDHVRRASHGIDPEQPLVDRVLSTMRIFEEALAAYSAVDNPRSSAEVVSELEAFHSRVFGTNG